MCFLRGTSLNLNTYICIKHGTCHLCDGINCILIGDSCVCGSLDVDDRKTDRNSDVKHRYDTDNEPRNLFEGGKAKNCPELIEYLKRTYIFDNVSNMIKDFVKEEGFVVPEMQMQSIIQRLYSLIHAHLCSDLKSMIPNIVLVNANERDSVMLAIIREELTRTQIKTCSKKDISFSKHSAFAKNVSTAITHDLTCSPDQLLPVNKTYTKTYTAFERIRRAQYSK